MTPAPPVPSSPPLPVGGPAVAMRVRGLHKSFGTRAGSTPVLRGVDLDVHAGELLMIAGPSGCGKTTLISILGGILDADGGTCMAFGCDFARATRAWLADFRRHRVGFVFQTFNLLPSLSVAENVALPLLLLGLPRREARDVAMDMLERVGLAGEGDREPTVLSGGQQQRVAIARALIHRPMLVICDEPTSALDHANGGRVIGLLRDLAVRDGRSVIVVTHDARILARADRIAHMDDGCIVRVEVPAAASDPAAPAADLDELIVLVDSDEPADVAGSGR